MFYVMILLLSIVFLVLSCSLLSWPFRIEGNVYLHRKDLKYSGTFSLGGQQRGIGFGFQDKLRYIYLGSTKKPLIQWNLSRKKKAEKKRETQILHSMKKFKKNKVILIKRLITNNWRSIHWDTFKVSGEFGLESPNQTGLVFGAYLGILNLMPNKMDGIDLVPDFTRQRLNIHFHSSFRIRPATIAWRVGSSYLTQTH